MLGNLLPHGKEAFGVLVGIFENALVVMHVQHWNQIVFQGLIDCPIHAVEEFRIDSVWRRLIGMGRPAHGYADRVEPGRRDLLEVVFLEHNAPSAFLRRFQGIAQVYAAAERRFQLLEKRIGEDLLHFAAVESARHGCCRPEIDATGLVYPAIP